MFLIRHLRPERSADEEQSQYLIPTQEYPMLLIYLAVVKRDAGYEMCKVCELVCEGQDMCTV
jgi:hypothetical protein